jgi:hypothetical protein
MPVGIRTGMALGVESMQDRVWNLGAAVWLGK